METSRDGREVAQAGEASLATMLTISNMARRYGLTLRALRFYEDRGLVTPLRHGTTRFYDAGSCRRIEMILRGKQLGYSIKEIAGIFERGSPELDPGIGSDVCDLQQQIGRLERKRHELDTAIAELRAVQHQSVASRPATVESPT